MHVGIVRKSWPQGQTAARGPGGTRHDWSGRRRGLQGVRRRTHALEVAARYSLGVVATDCRNRAVK